MNKFIYAHGRFGEETWINTDFIVSIKMTIGHVYLTMADGVLYELENYHKGLELFEKLTKSEKEQK